jgi:hypothetical protein
MHRKKVIEGEYHSISSQTENVQARKDIQNLIFNISNNMKNLLDSAEGLHLHPARAREQEKGNHGILGVFWTQSSQDKDNKKMIQAQKETIKKLLDRINSLGEFADRTTKWLQDKKLATSEIIEEKRKVEGLYRSIRSHIENEQARNEEFVVDY